MSDLVDKLRNVTEDDAYALPWTFGETCKEAADRIEQLERELVEAREFRAILEGHLAAAIDDYNEASNQAFEDAAQIAEDRTRDFCREGYVLQGPSYLGRAIAAALRAKAHPHSETRQEQR